uniref:Uncharacterized protein n=1 Tax=Anguilla anguilla TaxID=7936 RepID=A0A0E9SS68_ANGAN
MFMLIANLKRRGEKAKNRKNKLLNVHYVALSSVCVSVFVCVCVCNI